MKCFVRHCVLWSLAILILILFFAMHWKKAPISVRTMQQSESITYRRSLRNESNSVRRPRWWDLRQSHRSTNVRKPSPKVSISIQRFSNIKSKNGPKTQQIKTIYRRFWRGAKLNESNVQESQGTNSMRAGEFPKWKRVLFYTTVFGKNPKELWREDAFKGCKVPRCVLTDKRSSILQSDAVIFHGRDMPLSIPRERYSSQRWIYFNRENPQYTSPDAGKYNGIFNWTMTYKRASDIWAPYGLYRRINSLNVTASYKGRNISCEKSRLIAWATSHCESTGFLRERYVEQLALSVPIDVFGRCKPNAPECLRQSKECEQRLKTYKFYLAFENAFCEDYITEKFWEQAVRHEMVPIVMGGGDYKQLVPPKSYINILDFSSVDQLAKYLIALDRNSSAYNKYFEWKTRYDVTRGMRRAWCQLCKMLHDDSLPRKVYWDLGKFWSVKDNCLRHTKTILDQV